MTPARHAALVFDFDGTLVDAGDIKKRAYFAAMAQVVDSPRSALEAAHRRYGTLNRLPQLQSAFREVVGRSPRVVESAAMEQAFAEFVAAERHTIRPFPRIAEFLDAQRPTRYLAIASNAPQNEVEDACKALNLASRFDAVYGFPTSKPDALDAVRRRWDLPREALLFVGDRPEDGEAAARAGVPFCRFGPLEPTEETMALRDVPELARFVAERGCQ